MPSDLLWPDKTFAYTSAATDRNKLGIVGYQNPYLNQVDPMTFVNEYRTDAKTATSPVEKVNNGGYDPSHPGFDANLNTQYAEIMAYPTPHIYYSTGGKEAWSLDSKEPAPGDMFLEWLKYVLDQPKTSQTISTLYGAQEKILPLEYAKALCDLFAQLGAHNVGVLYASGNHGVCNGDCKVNDGSGRVQFIPMFSAFCPCQWVTSVGGTTGQLPEIAGSVSEGGSSFYSLRPDYQNDAAPTFFKHLGGQYDGLYNPAGRGIPDISMQVLNYLFVVDYNTLYMVGGTSCAAAIHNHNEMRPNQFDKAPSPRVHLGHHNFCVSLQSRVEEDSEDLPTPPSASRKSVVEAAPSPSPGISPLASLSRRSGCSLCALGPARRDIQLRTLDVAAERNNQPRTLDMTVQSTSAAINTHCIHSSTAGGSCTSSLLTRALSLGGESMMGGDGEPLGKWL
ncbi:peptidase S8/S53 domain-containing protein [Lactarius psammicola]|nr:peptidase S8/S53 domain-containing protein [Lactarius psammicola]